MESHTLLKKAARLSLAGAFIFFLIPAIGFAHRAAFDLFEPYYASPIKVSPDRTLTIRMDSFGKGYFGASRNGGRSHNGIDLVSAVGSPVLASKSGRVIFTGINRGYGHCVDILHPNGEWTRHAHLSRIRVREGQWVRRGDIVGDVGKSGNAGNPRMTPHLHYEIREGDEAIDPKSRLDPSLNLTQP